MATGYGRTVCSTPGYRNQEITFPSPFFKANPGHFHTARGFYLPYIQQNPQTSVIFVRMKDEVTLHIYSADLSSVLELPYADSGIKAGFPSPAQDYLTESIDLNKELVRHTETTFYAKVSGDSLMNAGISDGDLVVIDKSLTAKNGDYVAAFIDGEFTLKKFVLDEAHQCAWLVPANDKYQPIQVTADNDFLIWGVITSSIKRFHKF